MPARMENDSDSAIERLTELGFTLNEARAYVALLQGGPATGYEVGLAAQIPRSAVYGALRKLVSTGAARSIAGSPERFAATPVDAVMTSLRKRFSRSADDLERSLQALGTKPTELQVYAVRGHERALEEAERLIKASTDRLLLGGWPAELTRLAPELARAVARGVFLVTFSHAELPEDFPGIVYGYGLNEPDLEQFWKHRIFLVADDRHTLIAAMENTDDAAVVADVPAIAEVVASQITLDITLLAQRHGHDAGPVVGRLLGDRVGRLDTLLSARPAPSLGRGEGPPPARATRKNPKR